MNIGIDGRAARWYRGTGIGTYTYQLINSLSKVDRVNEYLLFMPEGTHNTMHLRDNFHVQGITESKSDSFWDEINIPNILDDSCVELYHVPQNGVGLPYDKRCKSVITLHDVIPYKMPETVSDRYLKIFHEEIPKIVSASDGIITVSNYSKKDIMEAFDYPGERIFVTELAAEDIYHPMDKELSRCLIKQYYSIDGEYILYLGGFSPRKNIIGLIEAFSKLNLAYNKDIKLVIAGKQGKSFTDYKNRAAELHIEDKVIFPGFVALEHLPYLYSAAEVFVYPSFYEGFGLPPVEAMSCGIPVISSNTTSIPEVVRDCAILVNPYDTDELSTAINNVLDDDKLKQELILKGLVRSSELTWNETARKTIIAYNKILNTI